jgi:hypothetical protein
VIKKKEKKKEKEKEEIPIDSPPHYKDVKNPISRQQPILERRLTGHLGNFWWRDYQSI